MSEMGEFWKDVNGAGQEKRATNRHQSPNLLKARGIEFERKNDGAHLIVLGPDKKPVADFWPGTGKFKFRDETKYLRGVRKLIGKFKRKFEEQT